MKLKQFAAAALCIAAGAIAAPAMAAPVTTVIYNITSLPNTLTDLLTTLNIKQFDAALGTLTGIEIDYSTSVYGQLQLSNASNKKKDVTAKLDATMTLTGPSALALGTSTKNLFNADSAHKVSAAANTPTLVKVIDGNGTLSTDVVLGSGSFASFIGTGDAHASLAVTALGTKASPTGVGSKFSTWAEGAGHVTYTFVAAPVPEPETYGMLLMGLGVVAFAAKRKSRAA